MNIDVLCVGHASYDLVFSVDHHPSNNEKTVADSFIACGGGPAANAAVMVAKLGLSAAFAGYLGRDVHGELHVQELLAHGVNTQCVVRGDSPTPLSTVIVKPDGNRALINYKGDTKPLAAGSMDFSVLNPKVILFDGHEPHISVPLAEHARNTGIVTMLDAGSVHDGTLALMGLVDYLVCSEKFALQLKGDEHTALAYLATLAPYVVITLGEHGLIWQHGTENGALPALAINAVDTTGAGDAFHGAFAAGIAAGLEWLTVLRYASVAGSLCCTKMGARLGLPSKEEHETIYKQETKL
ncbi:MAG: PfkB family carbohydrate kinase [Methylococcales bacterium]|nr:PfkB family carbohydrate kinase [Methylococcales bacterium]MDP3837518.1 PfkB family carbohydrate kinase [Methylococcales bacterium]